MQFCLFATDLEDRNNYFLSTCRMSDNTGLIITNITLAAVGAAVTISLAFLKVCRSSQCTSALFSFKTSTNADTPAISTIKPTNNNVIV